MKDEYLDSILQFEHEVDQRASELSEETNAILDAFIVALIAEVGFLEVNMLKGEYRNEPVSRKRKFLAAQRKHVQTRTAEIYVTITRDIEEAAKDVLSSSSKHTLNLILKTGNEMLSVPLVKFTFRSEVVAWTASDEAVALWREMTTVEGLTINQWIAKLERNTADRINAALMQAMEEGRGIRETIKFLQSKGIAGSRYGLEGLARTWMASASNYAREKQSEKALGDRLEGWRYSAILDGAACLVCGNDHGKEFSAAELRPSLPRHWRCRCLYQAMVKGWNQRPVKETYEQWMNRQLESNPDFVRKVLGKTRFDLFKDGKISLSKMTTEGRVKRLSEI